MQRTLAFDIELANVFDLAPGEDLEARAPFDIACAAAVEIGGATRHWYERDAGGRPTGHLAAATAREMLAHLEAAQKAGVRVVAWNGLSFDLRWLGHVADDSELARRVALELYDPMFQFFVQRGFPVGLAAVADAMGVVETKLMGGADAPKQWAAGEYQLVLDYVAGDCRITNAVFEAIEKERRIRWRTKKGTISSEPMAKLLPVRELLHAPEPDVSWMSTPLPRSKFTAWLAG
ncbi:MAG: hypothetical protein GC161_14225 [Planctomycetaceae bacterium]|nr:hypothetical protein [Planctomycetaceae bacterium]